MINVTIREAAKVKTVIRVKMLQMTREVRL